MVDPSSALALSIEVGLLSAALGLLPALGLGWLLARPRLPGKSILGTLVLAPLVLPPVVSGFLLLGLLGRRGLLGPPLAAVGISLPFSFAAAVIAATFVGVPLYVSAVRAAFEAIDPRYQEVALTLGATPRQALRRITLPLALPGIAAGVVLAFARGLGEFGATAVFAGNIEGRTRTIALALYALLEAPGGEQAQQILVLATLALCFAAIALYEWLRRLQRHRLEL